METRRACVDRRDAETCTRFLERDRSGFAARRAAVLREIAVDLRAHADEVAQKGGAGVERAARLRLRAREIEAEAAACPGSDAISAV